MKFTAKIKRIAPGVDRVDFEPVDHKVSHPSIFANEGQSEFEHGKEYSFGAEVEVEAKPKKSKRDAG